jgi:hypothetical protein
MIKVLANKVLAFDRNEKTKTGELIQEKTKIGFCSLPDWVGETDYFKLAVGDKSLSVVSMDTSVTDQQKIADLEKEVADLKSQQDVAVVTQADVDEQETVVEAKAAKAAKANKVVAEPVTEPEK